MKKLLIIALIGLVQLSVTAQVTEERFKWDHTPIRSEFENDQLIFEVDTKNTVDTADDVLVETRLTAEGKLIYSIKSPIMSSYEEKGIRSYEIETPSKTVSQLLMWLPEYGYSPMVVQEFHDGYSVYSGNLKY